MTQEERKDWICNHICDGCKCGGINRLNKCDTLEKYMDCYKLGYTDALAYVKSEIEERISDKEKILKQFSDGEYVSSVAATQDNIRVGLGVAKMVIEKALQK